MCMFNQPDVPDPVIPPEPAAAKAPDAGGIRAGTSAKMTDRLRAKANTVLTSGSGVTTSAPTASKTLLGA